MPSFSLHGDNTTVNVSVKKNFQQYIVLFLDARYDPMTCCLVGLCSNNFYEPDLILVLSKGIDSDWLTVFRDGCENFVYRSNKVFWSKRSSQYS